MLEFKSLADVEACAFDDPRHERVVRDAVKTLIDATSSAQVAYDPDADGWVVMLEPGDGDDVLGEFCSYGLPDMLWEGAVRDESGCILTCICTNNSFGVTVIVPNDGRFLSHAARARLLEELP